jgi:hypothetical protein
MLSGGINGGGMPLIYGANAETVFSGFTSGALYGGMGGAISGGIGSAFGSFTGVPGSAFKNTIAEMGYSTLKGAASGLAGGSVMAIASGDPSYFWKGAAFGAAFGAGMAGLRIASMGAAIIPPEQDVNRFSVDDEVMGVTRDNAPVYRRGGIASIIAGGGITIGRNLVVPRRFSWMDPDWYYETLAHERAHYYQMLYLGKVAYYSRIFRENVLRPGYKYCLNDPTTLEFWAEMYGKITP